MKRMKTMLFGACTLFCASLMMTSCSTPLPSGTEGNTKWHMEQNGTITVETPARPEGQESVIGLTVPKMDVVRVGFVGLGMRGPGAVKRWTYIPGTQIMALCDHEKERAEKCENILREASLPKADIYYGDSGYVELCKREDIDLVYVATDWIHHFQVAKCAMENGKNVAIEVPSATNLDEIWQLINLSEKTRKHCMILENCCYDWYELNALNMAQHGVFGEILHVQGAYEHNLGPYWDEYWKKDENDKLGWRLEFNMKHRGDIYATHGLGPVAQVLDIHRGDRMKTLVAMDTKSVNGKALVEERIGKCENFANGDHTTTLITTENGKVIEIQHCTMTPVPYSRLYQLIGSKGFANKYPTSGFALSTENLKAAGIEDATEGLTGHDYIPKEDMDKLIEKYQDPIQKKYEEMAKKVGGHGGMDFIEDSRLVYCLQHGLPLDMDVYDLAEWCCLADLGSISMENGCAPVSVPDFTRGEWNKVMGYRHAFATPEEEAEVEAKAEAFTAKLKEEGAKQWAAEPAPATEEADKK